jgi:hypothetical protein
LWHWSHCAAWSTGCNRSTKNDSVTGSVAWPEAIVVNPAAAAMMRTGENGFHPGLRAAIDCLAMIPESA